MRYSKIEGIIIKRTNSGEADRLLTIFTRSAGKIRVKATGVRRITSKRSSHLELLNHVHATLYQGKVLQTLMEVQTKEDFSPIKDDLSKIGFAYHICELIDGLCPEHQESEYIFTLLEKTLHTLTTREDIAPTIHAFEVDLLIHLGFYKHMSEAHDTSSIIEHILERKLKTKKFLPRLLS